MSTSPTEGTLRVAVKEVPGGKFSTFANRNLKVGDVLETLPPDGNLKLRKEQKPHGLLQVGITPILSQIKHVLESSEDNNFALFYVNKETASIIYKDELQS